MAEITLDLNQAELACKSIVQGGASIFKWEWDDGNDAVLSTYSSSDAPAVEALLNQHVQHNWSKDKLRQAPPQVQKLASTFGGLRSDQQLKSSDPAKPVMIVVALWPWSGGKTISIRIWSVSGALSKEAEQSLTQKFRSWFNR